VVWRESQKKRTAGELLGMAIHPLSGVHLRGWLSSVPIWMGLNLQRESHDHLHSCRPAFYHSDDILVQFVMHLTSHLLIR